MTNWIASIGRKAKETVLSGYTGVIDDLLRHGVTNSEVCYSRICELGYAGGKTSIKNYIKKHRYLGYRQEFCANLILDKPPDYQIPGQAVAVKVAVHLS